MEIEQWPAAAVVAALVTASFAITDPVRAEIGLSLLEGVYDMPWITTEDQALNTIVMQVLAAEEDPG